jgi:hypothetical protein
MNEYYGVEHDKYLRQTIAKPFHCRDVAMRGDREMSAATEEERGLPIIQLRTILLCLGVGLCALLLLATAARGAESPLPAVPSPWESARRHWSDQGYLPFIPAQDMVWCFCPAVVCSHSKMAGCTAACYAPKTPLCHCEAKCDLYAKAVGSNLCRCE